jgi:hypothetical protein
MRPVQSCTSYVQRTLAAGGGPHLLMRLSPVPISSGKDEDTETKDDRGASSPKDNSSGRCLLLW